MKEASRLMRLEARVPRRVEGFCDIQGHSSREHIIIEV
jgi:hypothetical protein